MNATVPDLVWCVYPISSFYTQFQRILFWVVTIIILFFQLHPWLTAGALAYAVTYSITAAIHAIFLGAQATSVYDADLLALQVVTLSSFHASILCVLFSPSIFNANVAPFYRWWCLVLYLARAVMSTVDIRAIWSIVEYTVPSNCTSRASCGDPCAGMKKVTMFRDATDSLQPVIFQAHLALVGSNVTIIDDWIAQAPIASWDEYAWLGSLWLWFFATAPVLQCALTNSWKDPREVRNLLFCRLRKRRVSKGHVQSRKRLINISSLSWTRYAWYLLVVLFPFLGEFAESVFWMLKKARGRKVTMFYRLGVLETRETKISYFLAKTLATMWFFVGESSYILSVVGAIYLTLKAEISMKWIPESESKKNIGQWSTWTAFGLALFATIIHRIVAKPRDEKKKNIILVDPVVDVVEAHEIALETKMIRKEHGPLFQYVLANIIYKWLEFKYWWNHTVEASSPKETEDKEARVQDESKVWDGFAPLFADHGDVVNVSRSLNRPRLARNIVV